MPGRRSARLVPPAPVHDVRACGLLRQLPRQARDRSLPQHRAPDHPVVRAARELVVVLRRRARFRCGRGAGRAVPSMRVVLDEATWRARAAAHEARVDGWLAGHLDRRRRGRVHPVEDFLFTYYSYRPGQLRAWHPGVGVMLAGARPSRDYVATPQGSTVDAAGVMRRRGDSVRSIADLLTRTAARPAQLGCFGLHELAMVYGQSPAQLRHTAWPLRLSPAETMSVVEQQRLRCTHFDAYRFFTEPARPLNLLALTRASQPALEQPGCLHANMDLYKWAYKLAPLTPSELVAD